MWRVKFEINSERIDFALKIDLRMKILSTITFMFGLSASQLSIWFDCNNFFLVGGSWSWSEVVRGSWSNSVGPKNNYYNTENLKPKKMKNIVCLFDGTPFSEIFEVTKKVGALIQYSNFMPRW